MTELMSDAPPSDVAAERVLLGNILATEGQALAEVEDLPADELWSPQLSELLTLCRTMRAAGDPVTVFTVEKRWGPTRRLAGKAAAVALVELVEIFQPLSTTYYAERVREMATLRAIVEAGTRARQIAYGAAGGSGGDVSDAVERARAEMDAATNGRMAAGTLHPVGEIVAGVMDDLDSGVQSQRVPVGLLDLDRLLGGGLEAGQLAVFAGRPGSGKSTLAVDVARKAAAAGRRVVVSSLEMSLRQIGRRILSAESGVSHDRVRTGGLGDVEWERIVGAVARMADWPLFIDESPAVTVAHVAALWRRMVRDGGLDLAIVDYLGLMAPESSRRDGGRQFEIAEMTAGMKRLAKELHIPVVLLSQLNREVERRHDKRPLLADLRDSGAVEQDTDVVVLLYRPDLYDQSDRPCECDIILEKNRDGAKGTVTVAAQLDRCRFVDMATGG